MDERNGKCPKQAHGQNTDPVWRQDIPRGRDQDDQTRLQSGTVDQIIITELVEEV